MCMRVRSPSRDGATNERAAHALELTRIPLRMRDTRFMDARSSYSAHIHTDLYGVL